MAGARNYHRYARSGFSNHRRSVGIAKVGVVLVFQNRLGGKNGFDLGVGEPANQIKIMNVHVAEDTATAFNELPGAGGEIVCGHGQRIQSANFTGLNLLFHFLNVFIKASLKTNLQRGSVFCC